jgi:citrate lyase subunit beta/citryl-CoA lyase
VVVDLVETSDVATKSSARQQAAEWLDAHRLQIVRDQRLGRWARINALDSRMWRDDLVAVMPSRPDGILLPRAAGPAAVQQLAAELYELEQRHQIPNGSTRIVPMAGDTAQSALAIADFGQSPQPRLTGLAWSGDELAKSIGATRMRDAKGVPTSAFQFVRAQVLLAAHGGGILALDALQASQLNDKALRTATAEARADGFSGMLAYHPVQVERINEAFTPNADEVAQAQAVLAAFEADNGGNLLHIDRRMVDQTQIRNARRMLGLDEQVPAEAWRGTPILRPA